MWLTEAEPGAVIVEDGGAGVGRMRGDAVGHHHFAHHQRAVLALAVGIDGDGLEHAIRTLAFSLHGRAAVEAPERKLFQRRKAVVFLDLRLATKIWHRSISVKPNILELILCHCDPLAISIPSSTHA